MPAVETTKKRKRTTEIFEPPEKRPKNYTFMYEDGSVVPENAKMRHQGRGCTSKHFVINKDHTETQIFRPDTLAKKRKKTMKISAPPKKDPKNVNYEDGSAVPKDAQGRHFIHDDKTENQIFTDETLRKKRKKPMGISELTRKKPKNFRYEDGSSVPKDAKISHEGNGGHSKHFISNEDNTKTQVFLYHTLYWRQKKQNKINDLSYASDSQTHSTDVTCDNSTHSESESSITNTTEIIENSQSEIDIPNKFSWFPGNSWYDIESDNLTNLETIIPDQRSPQSLNDYSFFASKDSGSSPSQEKVSIDEDWVKEEFWKNDMS